MLTFLSRSQWNLTTAAHLLNRAAFGGTPEQIEQLADLGPDGAVDYLVNYEKQEDKIPKPDWAKPDPEFAQKRRELRQLPEEERRQKIKQQRRQNRQNLIALRQWWLERMEQNERPLEEKMTLFWHGHFATSVRKVKDPYLMWKQNDIFRTHATGKWSDLLKAASKDPAMLVWLDGAKSKKSAPNENFAREVMELFTLGEGHYSEEDIKEAARAFTGWSVDRSRQKFQMRRRMHDSGRKTFMKTSGHFQGDDILEIILAQPQADVFITSKLWRFFASEQLDKKLQEDLARNFRAGGQRFKPFLEQVFRSKEFYAPENIRRQIKSPVQWLVGTSAMLDRALPPALVSHKILEDLGQSLFAPPNVKGWDGGIAWINTHQLLTRYNYAKDLVEGRKGKTMSRREMVKQFVSGQGGGREARMERAMNSKLGRMPAADVTRLTQTYRDLPREQLIARLERHFLQGKLKPERRQALEDYLVAHPQLTDDTLRHGIRLLMSTPEYQLT